MTPDSELLATFARTNSEDAFAELVKRHVNLVYSAALRQVNGDEHFAQDVAQTVFTDLARKAGSLARRESLTGWLYTSAHFAAAKIVRTETRRRDREETFMRKPVHESVSDAASEAEWQNLRSSLDAAMHELKETDREAILLRYFENRPFAEVGAKLGLNENSARMRVERAVEKLRGVFTKRGIATTSVLTAAITANTVQAAPVGLAVTISAAALAGTAVTTSTIIAATTKTIAMTTLQKTLVTATVAVLAGAGIYEARQAAQLRDQVQTLQQQQAPLTEQVQQLQNSFADATNRLADLLAEKPGRKSNPNQNELLKLRGEVGVLRRQNDELKTAIASLRNVQPNNQKQDGEQTSPSLPADYPRTGDGAVMVIFDSWGKGDWDSFFTNFGQPGVPREAYDKLFNQKFKDALAGMEIESVGQPTNGLFQGHYFVPYKVKFQNGEEKEGNLSVKQDPESKRWYFDGGF